MGSEAFHAKINVLHAYFVFVRAHFRHYVCYKNELSWLKDPVQPGLFYKQPCNYFPHSSISSQSSRHHKSQTKLGSGNVETMVIPHHVSHVNCHVSHVICQVSGVTFNVSDIIIFFFKVVKLVGGEGFVINGVNPVQLLTIKLNTFDKHALTFKLKKKSHLSKARQ